MFVMPPVVQTELFMHLPDAMRRPGQLSAERLRAGKGTLQTDCFLEGPSFDRHGNLYLVDIAFGAIYRVDPAGRVEEVIRYDGEPNGLKIHRDGRIFIADHKHGILLLDPVRGQVQPFLTRAYTEHFKGVNDLFLGPDGSLFFTDQGQTGLQDPTGRVYRYDMAGGVLTRLLDNVPSPNGIVTNAAQTLLYVAVTRANCIWRAMLLPDGTLTRAGVFVQLSGGTGPDGLALDEKGNLYVAHAGYGMVWKYSPSGEPLLAIRSCAGHMITNLAFGGPDRRDLYITESETGSVLVARMDTPGAVMHSHADGA